MAKRAPIGTATAAVAQVGQWLIELRDQVNLVLLDGRERNEVARLIAFRGTRHDLCDSARLRRGNTIDQHGQLRARQQILAEAAREHGHDVGLAAVGGAHQRGAGGNPRARWRQHILDDATRVRLDIEVGDPFEALLFRRHELVDLGAVLFQLRDLGLRLRDLGLQLILLLRQRAQRAVRARTEYLATRCFAAVARAVELRLDGIARTGQHGQLVP